VNHHFHKSEIDLKNNYSSWKSAYMEKKKRNLKKRKKIVYKFNKNNNYDHEWDHLQEKVICAKMCYLQT